MWDEEQDMLLRACRRPDPPLWADLLILSVALGVAAWMIYLVATA